MLILLGELTSPLQNLWYFARYLKDRSLVGLSVSLCFPCIVALVDCVAAQERCLILATFTVGPCLP